MLVKTFPVLTVLGLCTKILRSCFSPQKYFFASHFSFHQGFFFMDANDSQVGSGIFTTTFTCSRTWRHLILQFHIWDGYLILAIIAYVIIRLLLDESYFELVFEWMLLELWFLILTKALLMPKRHMIDHVKSNITRVSETHQLKKRVNDVT